MKNFFRKMASLLGFSAAAEQSMMSEDLRKLVNPSAKHRLGRWGWTRDSFVSDKDLEVFRSMKANNPELQRRRLEKKGMLFVCWGEDGMPIMALNEKNKQRKYALYA